MITFYSHSHPSAQRSQGMETTCPPQKLQDEGSAPGFTIEPGGHKNISNCTWSQKPFQKKLHYTPPCWSQNVSGHIPYHVAYFPDHWFV